MVCTGWLNECCVKGIDAMEISGPKQGCQNFLQEVKDSFQDNQANAGGTTPRESGLLQAKPSIVSFGFVSFEDPQVGEPLLILAEGFISQ